MCGGLSSSNANRGCIRYAGVEDSWRVHSTLQIGNPHCQFSDYHPDVGLIVAGGLFNEPSNQVEISTDNGQTTGRLPDLPYGDALCGACLAIVDTNTVFVAGGLGEFQRVW